MVESFANVGWTADDIRELRPDWSVEECNVFLIDNERQIRDDMTERGWASIMVLLPE